MRRPRITRQRKHLPKNHALQTTKQQKEQNIRKQRNRRHVQNHGKTSPSLLLIVIEHGLTRKE